MHRIHRLLRCDFTVEEMNERRDELSAATIQIGTIEEQKASANRAFKEHLDGLYSQTSKLAHEIKNRNELRSTECIVELNKPHVGEKTIIRIDTGELVSIEAMTAEERQEEFEFNQEASGSIDKIIEEAHIPPPDDSAPPQKGE